MQETGSGPLGGTWSIKNALPMPAYQPVKPKKRLGQHFLKDTSIAQKVAGSLTGHGNYKLVVEVGPGTGALTNYLVDHPDFRWMGVEVDRDAIAFLRGKYPALADHVLEQDFLRIDVERFFGKEQFAVAGNFPYNISTQILFKVLEHRDQVPEVVGMFQKEVAQRIASGPGNKVYGILSVLLQAFYEVELLFQVSEHVFEPPPKVKSAVIRMKRREDFTLACDEKKFFAVVKTAFNQRRKTLRNALRSMNIDWEKLPDQLSGLRAERLEVVDYVQLVNAIGISSSHNQ
jgi:16S rRNA (adenine1518-N6/adenine1519-N6)-dimethyltransferase